MTRARSLLGLALVLAAVGCGATVDEPPPRVFIAFQRDFAPYATWEKFDVAAVAAPDGHGAGGRKVFLNKRPPAGSTAFPVGTIIVKEIEGAQTFAMVKRGGGYAAEGAEDWEWFELVAGTDGAPAIVWRGIAPPAGENYAGISGGSCNGCHLGAKDNDYVKAPELRLSGL